MLLRLGFRNDPLRHFVVVFGLYLVMAAGLTGLSGMVLHQLARAMTHETAGPPLLSLREPRAVDTPQELPAKLDSSATGLQQDAAVTTPVSSVPIRTASLPDQDGASATPWHSGSEPTYRTMCVRLCDGFYFPVSFATSADQFGADEALCQSSCGTPARLFVFANPGQTPADMRDLRGSAYAQLATAYIFRSRYDPTCTCRGQPWDSRAEARHQIYALTRRKRAGDAAAAVELRRLGTKIRDRLVLRRKQGLAEDARLAEEQLLRAANGQGPTEHRGRSNRRKGSRQTGQIAARLPSQFPVQGWGAGAVPVAKGTGKSSVRGKVMRRAAGPSTADVTRRNILGQ